MSTRKRRARYVWTSQRTMLHAWLRSVLEPRHAGEVPVTTGHVVHYGYRSLAFESVVVISEQSHYEYVEGRWQRQAPENEELARLVQGARGRWVVVVRRPATYSQAYKYRMWAVQQAADAWGVPWVAVADFADVRAHAAWHSANVLSRYLRWKRARTSYMRRWRFDQMDAAVKGRERYERVFALPRTKEEPDVRVARVTQRLMASVTQ